MTTAVGHYNLTNQQNALVTPNLDQFLGWDCSTAHQSQHSCPAILPTLAVHLVAAGQAPAFSLETHTSLRPRRTRPRAPCKDQCPTSSYSLSIHGASSY